MLLERSDRIALYSAINITLLEASVTRRGRCKYLSVYDMQFEATLM